MAELSISAAARAAGVSRTTIQKAIKNGRLSATTSATGERVIDLSELLRVYGPLQPTQQGVAPATEQHTAGGVQGKVAPHDALIEVLQEQLRDARERERQTHEREQQAIRERERLLELVEHLEQSRRALEQKLLPPPPPLPDPKPPRPHHRLWILVLILVAAIAGLVWTRTGAYWPLGE